jgi:DNA-directed RNA polymerase sigma subunit (sigma70/sigma32)
MKISKKTETRIVTLRKQGKLLQEIADEFDFTRERVRQVLIDHNKNNH